MAISTKFEKLHHSPLNHNRFQKIGQFLTNFTQFAVDSAVNISSKGVDGGKEAYKIVLEGFKNQPTSLSVNGKPKCRNIELAEEMKARMEEIEEGMNNLKQRSKTSTELVEGSKPHKKLPNEGIKGSDLLKTNEKRVFIRSRL